MEDHLHLAAAISAKTSVSEFLRAVKASSCGWIHRSAGGLKEFAWQDGYSAFSVSQSQLDTVTGYINSQEAHHRKLTFEEELARLFERHTIDYDERFLRG